MFQTKWGEDLDLQTAVIDQKKTIRQVGLLITQNNTIRGLRMIGDDGEFIVDQVWYDNTRSEWVMQ